MSIIPNTTENKIIAFQYPKQQLKEKVPLKRIQKITKNPLRNLCSAHLTVCRIRSNEKKLI